MKKLFLAIVTSLLIGQAHATLLDKFPLTPKQTLVLGALVGAGAAALRYCYFYQKYLDNRDIVSGHIEEEHIADNDITLLDNSPQRNPCDKNICKMTDENTSKKENSSAYAHTPPMKL